MKLKIMPTTYCFVLFLLAILLHFFLPVAQLISPPYNYLGFILVFGGLLINLWVDSLFKQNKTTVKPDGRPTSLVVLGPFRISRHPMYLGLAMILFGTVILWGSLTSFISLIIFVFLMEALFIPMEEEKLEEVFGKQYFDYKKRVRRWI